MNNLLRFILFFLLSAFFTISQSEEKTADGLILQTVISEGIGETVQAAAQNAAQNALTNVVGSFVDSTKLLEKRTQIKDGIKSQTKNIKSDIKEYSQGSIRKFEILETIKENGLIKVTAKASIVIEDFKVYIKKLAESENTVEQGLFTILETEKTQSKNVNQLLRDLLNTALSGQVTRIEIGKPELSNIFTNMNSSNTQSLSMDRGNYEDSKFFDMYKFQVELTRTTDQSYIQNLKKTLDSVSSKRISMQINWTDASGQTYNPMHFDIFERSFGYNRKNSFLGIMENIPGNQNSFNFILYKLPITATDSPTGSFIPGISDFCRSNRMEGDIHAIAPKLVIELLDGSGTVISEMHNSEFGNRWIAGRSGAVNLGRGKFISWSYVETDYSKQFFKGVQIPWSSVTCTDFGGSLIPVVKNTTHKSLLSLPITDSEKSAVKIRGKLVQQ